MILLTNSEDFQDTFEFDQGSIENQEKRKVENSVMSSLFVRKTNDQRSQIFRYTFTIYTTATPDSMLKRNQIDFPLHNEVKKTYFKFSSD